MNVYEFHRAVILADGEFMYTEKSYPVSSITPSSLGRIVEVCGHARGNNYAVNAMGYRFSRRFYEREPMESHEQMVARMFDLAYVPVEV